MYHLFSGYQYYPGGGLADYVGSAITLDEAKALRPRDDWSEVVTERDGALVLVSVWTRSGWEDTAAATPTS